VRFVKLIEDLENQHTKGIKSFPQTLTEALFLSTTGRTIQWTKR